MTTPPPDDNRLVRRRYKLETPAQVAERQRVAAERRARDTKRKADWLAEKTRRAKLARLVDEAAAPTKGTSEEQPA